MNTKYNVPINYLTKHEVCIHSKIYLSLKYISFREKKTVLQGDKEATCWGKIG